MAGAPIPVNFNPNAAANFSPYGTVVINATGTSASAVFTTNLSINANSVMVFNETTKTVYVAFGYSGNGTVSAVAPTSTESYNATPVGAGAILFFTNRGATIQDTPAGNGQYDTVAAIAPNGATGNVYFTMGEGA